MSEADILLQEVERRLRDGNNEVVAGVVTNVMTTRKPFIPHPFKTCNCEHCQVLRPYVYRKVALQKIKRALHEYDYPYSFNEADADEHYAGRLLYRILMEKGAIRRLKEEKDKLVKASATEDRILSQLVFK